MSFDSIFGQEFAVGTLRRALQTGRLHHAYRFEGPDGIGKGKTALALAQALVCEHPREGEGCGSCSSCRRAVTISSEPPHVPKHPDILVLERGIYASTLGKELDEKQNISTEQVRRVLLSRIMLPPHEGRGRLVLIRNAEELHPSAANALLKTLEEPPPRTHFVLLSSRGRMLLDTIRSRAVLVRFAPLRREVMREILKNLGVEVSDQLLELSGGSISSALALSRTEETEARRQFVEEVRRAILAPNASGVMALAQARDKEKEVLRDRLSTLAIVFSREAREREMAGEPGSTASEWARSALKAIRELERNVSPALVLETMLFRMRSI